MLFVILWVASGVVGTILREYTDGFVTDSAEISGLFPSISWIGPMIGGILIGPMALLIGIGIYLEEKKRQNANGYTVKPEPWVYINGVRFTRSEVERVRAKLLMPPF